jgi:hypothetical protein
MAHAFGERYELSVPLYLFLLAGAGVVLLSFWLMLPRKVTASKLIRKPDPGTVGSQPGPWVAASIAALAGLIAIGLFGTQEVAENLLPTVFWVVVWIAVPLSCGLVGDWTANLNPFAALAKLADSVRLRRFLLGREQPLAWPKWLGWWPAVLLFFVVVCGELIFNQTAVIPGVTAVGLLAYAVISAFLGMLYGRTWLERGELFAVLFNTWGRLGYFRFDAPGRQGFAGGFRVPYAAELSRVVFVLLLLVSVGFDGLLSTPAWNNLTNNLPEILAPGTGVHELFLGAVFIALVVAIWAFFSSLALAVSRVGAHNLRSQAALAGLLPSLVPISFGYLLAHYLNYLLINGQLLFPLLGNPIGKESWPLRLPYPFNDSFDPNIHLLPTAFYWYIAVLAIVAAHVIAVIIAHRHLGTASRDKQKARRSEYPWVVAMVVYTILSLWLLAQPLAQEDTHSDESVIPQSTSRSHTDT